jgi:type I restriction enzyme S subunit
MGDIFIRIQNVGKNELMLNDLTYVDAPDNAESKRTAVQAGDILLSITADLGRTAVIPSEFPKAHINQHLAIIRLKSGYNPYYISEFIASEGGKRQFIKLDKGGVKAGLNFTDIKSLKLLNPPLNIQNQYLKIVKEIKNQKLLAQQALKKSEDLFNSLLQQAFKGELTNS